MTAKRLDFPSYPVWPTVLILTLLAMLSAVVVGTVTFAGNAVAVASTGPFGWLVYGPALMASYATAATAGAIAVPVWSVLGGWFFASGASTNTGTAAADMNVKFFPETHEIFRVTQRLAEHMGLPKIAYIGWYPNEDINAFAMGTSPYYALIAVSKGAVERLTKQELIAVLAHELGHVASNDMARMTYARGLQNALTFFLISRRLQQAARWIFTPLSELELLRMSRAREFTADRISAMVIGPNGMISALEKFLKEENQPQTNGYANVMMWSGLGDGSLFSTHPPLEERIARLKAFQKTRQPSPAPDISAVPAIAE